MSALSRMPDWMRALYPFSPQAFATPGGAQMSFLDEGPRKSSAVLMLHGNPTWSFYYRDVVRALGPTRRCVVPDHIGMGLSEKPANYAYTLARRIEDVCALIDHLEIEQIDLVVHDWGGAIGFGVAARRPERVRRLVLMNTAAFTSDDIPARIALCKLPYLGALVVRGCNGFAGPAAWMAMHRRELAPDVRRGLLFPYDSWANRVAVHAFVRDIPLADSHPSQATLLAIERALPTFRDRPALIVWGGRDFCFNDRFLARWREFLPGATVERIADAGHYVLEDAREQVVPRIAGFLADEPSVVMPR